METDDFPCPVLKYSLVVVQKYRLTCKTNIDRPPPPPSPLKNNNKQTKKQQQQEKLKKE